MSVHADAPAPLILDPAARDAAVRRNTFLLAGAQGLVSTTFSVLLIVGSVAAADLAGRDGIVGVVNAGYFLAAAGGAMVFGRSMDRYGRRAGLVVSYLAVALAGIGCGAAIAAGSLPALLVFTTLFGFSFGGTNLARGAVADMYPAERRGRAVGIVLAVGTLGAVGSPFLVAFLRSWSEREALDPLVVPWILVPIAAVGALACALALRPDPRALAVRDHAAAPHVRRAPSELLASPAIRTAVLTAAIGQMAMVAVMGVTPVALEHHHSSPTVISTVISVHVFGMWGLSPLIGVALDRIGRRPVLLAGGVISVAGAVLAGTDAGPAVVGTGLFAIGLGWSATFLGATAVVSDATQPSERAGALGFTDLVISLSSGAAGLVGGFVFEGAGMRVLGFGVATVVLLVVVAVARMRETVRPAAG